MVVDYKAPLYPKTPLIIQIPPNTNAQQIAQLLEKAQVIPAANLFYLNVRLRGLDGLLRAGEYEFPAERTLQSVLAKLLRGEVLYHKLTIPEGLTSQEIKDLLLKDDRLVGDFPLEIKEGTLLPETYTFPRGESRQALVQQMVDALTLKAQVLWGARQQGLPFETLEEALTLASIIEKETALAGERQHIASVFINRLRKNMPLQSDPTVLFAFFEKTQKDLGRPLTQEDLKIDSSYNTYRVLGLPPGPICHPGIKSLEAVLNPLESEDLYFVADGTGAHVFSKTYAEHHKNHQRWRALQKQKK